MMKNPRADAFTCGMNHPNAQSNEAETCSALCASTPSCKGFYGNGDDDFADGLWGTFFIASDTDPMSCTPDVASLPERRRYPQWFAKA
jgi:hypothetical protein